MRLAFLLLTSVLACTPSPARQEPQPKVPATTATAGQAAPSATADSTPATAQPQPANPEPANPQAAKPQPAPAPRTPPRVGPGPIEVVNGGKLVTAASLLPDLTRVTSAAPPESVGWLAATDEFAYCTTSKGVDCRRCIFEKRRGGSSSMHVGSGEGCRQGVKPATMKARLRGLQAGLAGWAHGAAIVFVTHDMDDKGFKVGARLRSDPNAAVAWLHVLKGKSLHLDGLVLSPDGKTFAVLGHDFPCEFCDSYPTTMLDAKQVALKAYETAGLAYLKGKDFAAAAHAFEQLGLLDRSAWRGPYLLACAHAGAGDDKAARKALEFAAKRNRTAVRAKAASDPRLKSVRDKPWFSWL